MQKPNTTGATIADVEPSKKTYRTDINEDNEMIKTQGYTDNDSRCEFVKMDDVSGSVVPKLSECDHELKVIQRQKEIFYNPEPEYQTDSEPTIGFMMDISVY